MTLPSYLFKTKALRSLKGNWQTALLVSFFAGILVTVAQLVSSLSLSDLANDYYAVLFALTDSNGLANATGAVQSVDINALSAYLGAAVDRVPTSTWVWVGITQLLRLIFTPVLQLGCNHYFVSRMRGEELGFTGLFSRLRHVGKALLLSILIGIKVFLWSMLFIVPGIIASIRYSMAAYYLAEEPGLSAWEAIEKSKAAMKNAKMSFFLLSFSFYGWILVSTLVQMMLSGVLSLVIGQGIDLFIGTYMAGAYAAFFLVVSNPQELETIKQSGYGMWAENAPPDETAEPEDEGESSTRDGPQDPQEENRPKPSDYYPKRNPGQE